MICIKCLLLSLAFFIHLYFTYQVKKIFLLVVWVMTKLSHMINSMLLAFNKPNYFISVSATNNTDADRNRAAGKAAFRTCLW